MYFLVLLSFVVNTPNWLSPCAVFFFPEHFAFAIYSTISTQDAGPKPLAATWGNAATLQLLDDLLCILSQGLP